MKPEDEARFRQLFLTEATEQLDRLADTVLELERAGGGAELVATLFRDAHTLKSSAALVGLDEVSTVAHGLEDLLGELRAGARVFTPALADGVLDVVDAVRALIVSGLAGEPDEAHVARALAALARAGVAAPAPAPEPSDGGVAFRRSFDDEVGPELARSSETAPDLERRGAEPELIATRPAAAAPLAPAIVRPPALPSSQPRSAPSEPLAPAIVRPPPLAAAAGSPEAREASREGRGEFPPAGEASAAVPEGPAFPPADPPTGLVAPAESLPAPEAPTRAAAEPRPSTRRDDRPVPVALDHLDHLVRLSGEAVAAQLRLAHLLRDHIAGDPIAEAAAVALRRVLGDVQEQTMRTRMTSFEGVAGHLRRAARDVARATGKEAECTIEGERVELDRAVLDGLRDPLLHLVRNAVDHGIELPEAREAAGKPRAGSVRVSAQRRGPEVVVTVVDDGAGLDLARLRERAGQPGLDDHDAALVSFRPGLSTATEVTGISGRGVGLDAVRDAVQALRGRVDVTSAPGAGARFTVTVPLTLAVVPCVQVEAAGERYHLPTHATVTIAGDDPGDEVGLEGGRALWVGSGVVPLSMLTGALGRGPTVAEGPALVLEGPGGARHAFRVDAVLGQRDVTVKELGAVVPRTQLVAGASVEPDGSVVLVLDATALVEAALRRREPLPNPPVRTSQTAAAATILVVDDALTVRELQRSILERAGYAVRLAGNGQEALARLTEARPDLVVTDVEMPLLDGYELARTIRRTPALQSIPVLMLTSRDGDEDQRRGLEAGADAYLVKHEFDAARLLDAVHRLLGA